MQRVISSVPSDLLSDNAKKSKEFPVKNGILKKLFHIPGGKERALEDLTSKEIYNIMSSKSRICSNSNVYWSSKFPLSVINWKIYFRNNFVNYLLPRKCKDFNWKLFYGQVNTENKLKRMNLSSGKCCICKHSDENLEHMLYYCDGISLIWTEIEIILCKVLNHNITICLFHVLLGYFDDDQISSDIVNVLFSIARWEIWKRRNCIRYENDNIPVKKLFYKVKYEIKKHLQMLVLKAEEPIIKKILEIL